MSYVVPDDFLNTLICSTCGKYLSVKPIKIYPNGLTKCGRCTKSGDDGVISLFGNVIQNGLFPCINRYEGCMVHLTYSENAYHENICVSGLYECPICPPDKYKPASAYLLLHHYKKCHPNETINSPEFFININEECDKNILYCKNNYLYIINARRYINEEYIYLNASNISHKERCNLITQKVKLHTLDKQLLFETKLQSCSTFNNNLNAFKIPLSKLIYSNSNFVSCSFIFDTSKVCNFILLPSNLSTYPKEIDTAYGLHNVYPKIYLSPEFREAYPNFYLAPCKTKIIERLPNTAKEIEFPRICSFCENIFQSSGERNNLHKCNQNHFICDYCFTYNSDCSDGPYCYAERETEIYNLLFFYCKWNCHRFYCGQDLRYHELHCKKNEEIFFNAEQIGKKYFGDNYSTVSNCITQHSNVFPLDEIGFETISKIFVITRDNFSFILHCLKERNNLRFWFSHEYPIDKYYLLVRIKERHLPFYTRVNSFTLDASNRNIIFFSVVLRKVY